MYIKPTRVSGYTNSQVRRVLRYSQARLWIQWLTSQAQERANQLLGLGGGTRYLPGSIVCGTAADACVHTPQQRRHACTPHSSGRTRAHPTAPFQSTHKNTRMQAHTHAYSNTHTHTNTLVFTTHQHQLLQLVLGQDTELAQQRLLRHPAPPKQGHPLVAQAKLVWLRDHKGVLVKVCVYACVCVRVLVCLCECASVSVPFLCLHFCTRS